MFQINMEKVINEVVRFGKNLIAFPFALIIVVSLPIILWIKGDRVIKELVKYIENDLLGKPAEKAVKVTLKPKTFKKKKIKTEHLSTRGVRDYQMFTTKDMSIEDRRKLDVGDIWSNSIRCKKCMDVIRSKNRHHMQYCKCGSVFVDGGSWYSRRGGDLDNIESLIEMYDRVDNTN